MNWHKRYRAGKVQFKKYKINNKGVSKRVFLTSLT